MRHSIRVYEPVEIVRSRHTPTGLPVDLSMGNRDCNDDHRGREYWRGEGWNPKIPSWLTVAKALAKWVRLRSGTKVGRPKEIRYLRSVDYKRCRLMSRLARIGLNEAVHLRETQRRAPGGVWSQGWNLKELTEGHYKMCILWLNLTQHRKIYQVWT